VEVTELDDGVAAMLAVLDAGFPVLETMTAEQARVAISARVVVPAEVAQADVSDHVLADDGPRARVYQPCGNSTTAAVLFCHGGGFVLCDLETHDAFCRELCAHTGMTVVSVDYRRAPEHRAPTAALDCIAAYDWFTEHAGQFGVDANRVVVGGDSAGGNLAAVTAIYCRDRGGRQPIGQVLLYPVIDPSFDTPSYRTFGTGYFNTEAAMRWYWQHYLGGTALPEPAYLVAPSRADSHCGLPPAVVVTARLDPLHSEGVGYAEKLRSAGVSVLHRDYPGLFHGFLTMMTFPATSAARQLLWSDIAQLAAAVPEPQP
jgi:acetyl esterase